MLGATVPPTLRARALHFASAAGLGTAVLPAVATIGEPVHGPIWQAVVAAAIAAIVIGLTSHHARARYGPLVGVAVVGGACWLLAQASYPVAAWLIAPMLGIGISLAAGAGALPRANRDRAMWGVTLVSAAALIVIVRVVSGRDAAMAGGAIVVALTGATVTALRWGEFPGAAARGGRLLVLGGPMLALVTAAYIGATTPSVTWFGSLTHHGSRGGDEVAITFDDGPNPPFTLEISAILDRYSAKGTFFSVGKALEARPDVAKALLDDGQLLGNHSYTHDALHWLDPRYGELGQTQDAFKRTLGVCPAFFRPPHGSHTPFMAHEVSNAGMMTVTWDVSAGDWATADGQLVARRVLDNVQPGSIILLHDGIDGNIGADRSVIIEALPLILDGLRQRRLKPVTLDKLLGVPGYLEGC